MTVAATWPLPPGSAPSAMAIDRTNHRIFSGCAGKKLYVLDCDSGEILATLPIGGGVDAATYDPVTERVFASCGDGTLSVIKQVSRNEYSVEEQAPTQKGARTIAFDSTTQTAYLPTAKFGPAPPATADHPNRRPAILPGTMELLVITHS